MGQETKAILTGIAGFIASLELNMILQTIVLLLTIAVMAFQLRKHFWTWVGETRAERERVRAPKESGSGSESESGSGSGSGE